MKRYLVCISLSLSMAKPVYAKCSEWNIGHCVDNLVRAAADIITLGGEGRNTDKRRANEQLEKERIAQNEKIKSTKQILSTLELELADAIKNKELLMSSLQRAVDNRETINYLYISINQAITDIQVSINYSDQQSQNTKVLKTEIEKLILSIESDDGKFQNKSLVDSLQFLTDVGLQNIEELNLAILEIVNNLNKNEVETIVRVMEVTIRHFNEEISSDEKLLDRINQGIVFRENQIKKYKETLAQLFPIAEIMVIK